MYIAIAGNIGSGKTTLTEMLTERYGAKAYYEQSDNPYIGDFYNDMNRWSFNLQMYFLGSRIQQTMDILRSGQRGAFALPLPAQLHIAACWHCSPAVFDWLPK